VWIYLIAPTLGAVIGVVCCRTFIHLGVVSRSPLLVSTEAHASENRRESRRTGLVASRFHLSHHAHAAMPYRQQIVVGGHDDLALIYQDDTATQTADHRQIVRSQKHRFGSGVEDFNSRRRDRLSRLHQVRQQEQLDLHRHYGGQ